MSTDHTATGTATLPAVPVARATVLATDGSSADFVGRGWAWPVTVAHNGAVATVGGVANLEKAMRIVLRTYLGERPMRPDFGSRLRDYLFDGVNDHNARAIAAEVGRALHSCEPRVDINAVEVTPVLGPTGRFDIEIVYTVRGTNDEHNLVMPFYTIPGEGH